MGRRSTEGPGSAPISTGGGGPRTDPGLRPTNKAEVFAERLGQRSRRGARVHRLDAARAPEFAVSAAGDDQVPQRHDGSSPDPEDPAPAVCIEDRPPIAHAPDADVHRDDDTPGETGAAPQSGTRPRASIVLRGSGWRVLSGNRRPPSDRVGLRSPGRCTGPETQLSVPRSARAEARPSRDGPVEPKVTRGHPVAMAGPTRWSCREAADPGRGRPRVGAPVGSQSQGHHPSAGVDISCLQTWRSGVRLRGDPPVP